MNDDLRSVLLGTGALWIAAVAAILLTLSRPIPSPPDPRQLRAVVIAMTVAIGIQLLHFGEEWMTCFHERWPPLLGLTPWSDRFFVTFNLVWIVVWVMSVFGLRAGWQVALMPAWFLAIAAVMNGVAHALLSLRVGGYFPGLLTAPAIGACGLWLTSRLRALTEATVSARQLPAGR